MNMEELKIIALAYPGSIQFNAEEVKAGLAGQMELYKNLPVHPGLYILSSQREFSA